MVVDPLRERTDTLGEVWKRFLVEKPWRSAEKVNCQACLYTNIKSLISSRISREFSKLLFIQKNLAILTCVGSG